jgi:hypothetical protein
MSFYLSKVLFQNKTGKITVACILIFGLWKIHILNSDDDDDDDDGGGGDDNRILNLNSG